MALCPHRCAELRLSYAHQILIYAKARNHYGHLARTLFDSWHAAKRGGAFLTHPRGNSKPGYNPVHLNKPKPHEKREALLALRHSKAAHEIMHYRAAGDLIKDHSVPIALLASWIREAHLETPACVDRLLDQWYHVALITKGEHDDLDEAGLQSAMPRDWNGKDPWARYAAAGIDLMPLPLLAPL